ncbi:hypothetical protein C2E25_11665 [Geothermobacter hydrogeniphilus]|uniref:Uncharacterized protein n=1 Tax=Geothermobacter hydrogeniphilus TaxID=1969733 RepID=A0A2K2H8P1_9BACT|nr:hypothetical protein C2E25_11665 [Geothermobacter hydrogeniphilus]
MGFPHPFFIPESVNPLSADSTKSLTCLSFPKITSEPMSAPQLFGNPIQAKHLHSPSNRNSLIQVILSTEPDPIQGYGYLDFNRFPCNSQQLDLFQLQAMLEKP